MAADVSSRVTAQEPDFFVNDPKCPKKAPWCSSDEKSWISEDVTLSFRGGGNSKIFGICSPRKSGKMNPCLTFFFQGGWNHQPVLHVVLQFSSMQSISPLEDFFPSPLRSCEISHLSTRWLACRRKGGEHSARTPLSSTWRRYSAGWISLQTKCWGRAFDWRVTLKLVTSNFLSVFLHTISGVNLTTTWSFAATDSIDGDSVGKAQILNDFNRFWMPTVWISNCE